MYVNVGKRQNGEKLHHHQHFLLGHLGEEVTTALNTYGRAEQTTCFDLCKDYGFWCGMTLLRLQSLRLPSTFWLDRWSTKVDVEFIPWWYLLGMMSYSHILLEFSKHQRLDTTFSILASTNVVSNGIIRLLLSIWLTTFRDMWLVCWRPWLPVRYVKRTRLGFRSLIDDRIKLETEYVIIYHHLWSTMFSYV
jgi:hypothetical protein